MAEVPAQIQDCSAYAPPSGRNLGFGEWEGQVPPWPRSTWKSTLPGAWVVVYTGVGVMDRSDGSVGS
jgi:hypothetical protein